MRRSLPCRPTIVPHDGDQAVRSNRRYMYGDLLTIALTIVPSTKYVLRYHLELRGQDELEGEVDVDGGGAGGGSTTYEVKWVRESDEP